MLYKFKQYCYHRYAYDDVRRNMFVKLRSVVLFLKLNTEKSSFKKIYGIVFVCYLKLSCVTCVTQTLCSIVQYRSNDSRTSTTRSRGLGRQVFSEILKPTATHLAILYADRSEFDRQRKSRANFAID